MRKSENHPHVFLGWICQLGRFPGPLNGEWLKIKPAYPAGEVEPVLWRELPATDQRCEVPFQDESGLWRMGSRLGNTRFLTYDAKFNIILPRHHGATQLIIRHYHEAYNHELPAVTLNEMRQRFVLNGLRVELNNVCSRCPRCILQRAKPLTPQMASLPDCRLAIEEDAFTHVGIDIPCYPWEKERVLSCTG